MICGTLASALLGLITSVVFYYDTALWAIIAYFMVCLYGMLGVVSSGVLAFVDDGSQGYGKMVGIGIGSVSIAYAIISLFDHFANGTPFEKMIENPVNLIATLLLVGLSSATGYFVGSRKILDAGSDD